ANSANPTTASQASSVSAISQIPLSMAVAAATPPVRTIVDPAEDYRKRMTEIDSLSASFEPADQRVIENFLAYKDPQDSSQQGQVIKNELLNVLCSMSPPP